MLNIKENINLVRDEIKQNSHKTEKAIRLVAVSKGQNYIAIKSAYDAGKKSSVKTTYRKHWRKRNFLKTSILNCIS